MYRCAQPLVNPDITIVLRGMDARAGASGGEFDVQLHDKLAALTVLIKHLGGLPDERPSRSIRRSTSSPGEQRGATLGNIAPGGSRSHTTVPETFRKVTGLRTWCAAARAG
jgi:hypothetical protein